MAKPAFDEERFRELRVRVRRTFLELGNRSAEMLERFKFIEENVKDIRAGAGSPRRGLFVMGESGTGKSFALAHHLTTYPGFQPKLGKWGRMTQPVVSIVAKERATGLGLMAQALDEMGVPVPRHGDDIRKDLLEQFVERETIVFHIDEMQHSTRSNTNATVKAVQEWTKDMMSLKHWPLHVIVSGMPTLDVLLAEKQVDRRSRIITFDVLACPADIHWVRHSVHEIAVVGCGLGLAQDVTSDDFHERLCHASLGGFGTMTELTQEACFRAIRAQRSEVALRHFANEYDSHGSPPEENIFKSPDWRELSPIYGGRN